MKVVFDAEAWDDYRFRQAEGAKVLARINHEHRLVYCVSGKGDTQAIEVAQCRYHY
jgi:toxin YoeB